MKCTQKYNGVLHASTISLGNTKVVLRKLRLNVIPVAWLAALSPILIEYYKTQFLFFPTPRNCTSSPANRFYTCVDLCRTEKSPSVWSLGSSSGRIVLASRMRNSQGEPCTH